MDPGGCRDGPFGSGSVSVVGGEGRNWERKGGFQAAGGAWSRGEDREKTEPWEVYFREEEADAGRISSRPAAEQREEKEEEFQTILLAARPLEIESRKLTAFSGNLEIPLTYFPFLIGKSREMADFCLNEPGVSRLHVKIEEKDGAYTITDLNSTNGTKVNGRLLEANETCSLESGSEVEIAGRRFRFR